MKVLLVFPDNLKIIYVNFTLSVRVNFLHAWGKFMQWNLYHSLEYFIMFLRDSQVTSKKLITEPITTVPGQGAMISDCILGMHIFLCYLLIEKSFWINFSRDLGLGTL